MFSSICLRVFVLSVLSAFLLASCGGSGVNRSTWIISAAGDTVCVGEIGEQWNRMTEDAREQFLSYEDPVGEYLKTYGRRLILERDLEEAGYLTDSSVESMTRYWLLSKTVEAAESMLFQSVRENVDQEMVDKRIDHVRRLAFFTMDPGGESETRYGPIHVPSLPDDMMDLVVELEDGETGTTAEGMTIRLDSIVASDSTMILGAIADSTEIRPSVENVVAQLQFDELMAGIQDSLRSESGLSIDSSAVDELAMAYSTGNTDPLRDSVLMQSQLGTWTAGDVADALDFFGTSQQTYPEQPEWLYSFLDYLNYSAYLNEYLSSRAPDRIDSLQVSAEEYRFDLASNMFYRDSISAAVEVTQADMLEEFENLEEPLMIAEQRIFQAINIRTDSAMIFADLPEDQREEFLKTVPGFPWMAADSTNPQFTRPVLEGEIPGFNGDEVFAIDPSDTTTWLGPLEMYTPERKCFFRLIDIVPEHEAAFEEVQPRIERMTRERLEEERTLEVLRRLEEKYSLQINSDVLEALPEDPGQWEDL